jgi:hypothetical protein
MTNFWLKRALKKLKKNLSTSGKKSLNPKKMKNRIYAMKNKRNSVEFSEKTWIDKRKPIIVSSNVEGYFKNLANQVK